MNAPNPYFILGIRELVTDEEVKTAYHRKLRLHPPESDPEAFARISEAYESIRHETDRLRLRLFGNGSRPDHLAQLAEGEEPETPSMDKNHFRQAALRHWLLRKGAASHG